MAEIGGFQFKDFFFFEINTIFALFVLSLILSVAVCRRVQQVFFKCAAG